VLGWRHYQYVVTEKTQPKDLLYRFDLTRRILDAQARTTRLPPDFAYVEPGVLWWALDARSAERRGAPEGERPPIAAMEPLVFAGERPTAEGVVVLVDDIDKAPADLPESLVRLWATGSFYVEEAGVRVSRVDRSSGSLLVLTVVGDRELPLALKRRCVLLTLSVPDVEQLLRIAEAHGLVDDRARALDVAHRLLQDFEQRAWPMGVGDFLDALRITRRLAIEPGTQEWQLAVLPQLAFAEPVGSHTSTAIAPPGRSCRVFLCHSSNDKPAVRKLYGRLRQEGLDAWLDEENIIPGQTWDLEIRRAVQDADLVIVCLSHGSVTKTGYVQREISMVLDLSEEQPEGKIYLIPARLEECEVPRRLARFQWVDLFQPDGYNRLLSAVWIAAERLGLPAAVGESH
jgi:MoxR-like ATPase